jgi:ribosomal-protein-alanine N-acetyltransferase
MPMRQFDRVTLRTERLVLRPLREGDATDLFGMRYWSTPPWPTVHVALETIARHTKAMASGEYLQLGIECHTNARLVGTCTLFGFVEQCKRAELGYALAHSAWGHGYMHEALSALLNYAFSVLELNRIEADIDPQNEGSARTLQRLGFQQEGYLRERWIVNGEVSDSALYGLLRREWQAIPQGTA